MGLSGVDSRGNIGVGSSLFFKGLIGFVYLYIYIFRGFYKCIWGEVSRISRGAVVFL